MLRLTSEDKHSPQLLLEASGEITLMHGVMETIQNSENMRQLLNGASRGQRVIFTRVCAVRHTFYKP